MSDHFICQLKSTDKQSININQNDIHTLEYNACVSHKTPVFAFQFLNTDEVWVAIKEDEFKEYRAFKELLLLDKFPVSPLCDKKYLDGDKQKDYNKIVPDKNAGKNLQARQRYEEQKKMERNKKQDEYKIRQRERRQQIGKEVKTKRCGNI